MVKPMGCGYPPPPPPPNRVQWFKTNFIAWKWSKMDKNTFLCVPKRKKLACKVLTPSPPPYSFQWTHSKKIEVFLYINFLYAYQQVQRVQNGLKRKVLREKSIIKPNSSKKTYLYVSEHSALHGKKLQFSVPKNWGKKIVKIRFMLF